MTEPYPPALSAERRALSTAAFLRTEREVVMPEHRTTPLPEERLRLSDSAGRWTLLITAVGSGLVLLEATVVNVALPALEREFAASLTGLQWTVNAFTVTLSTLILLGGALGDRFGRRQVYLAGVACFAVASLLCGLAPTLEWLIAGRALQGIGGALIVPGSLALIQESFAPGDRARALGWWAGLSGAAGALGPLFGGVLVDTAGWRWVFLINVPIAAAMAVALLTRVRRTRAAAGAATFDLAGAASAAVGLGGLTYALTNGADDPPGALAAAVIATIALVAFWRIERRHPHPMLPLTVFRSRSFSAANLAGFFVYGALAVVIFALPIQLQVTTGYSASTTGIALIPLTVATLALSPRGGTLATTWGPRTAIALGSLICAAALLLATRVGPASSYLTDVLPVVALIGIGIPLITPALTATVLNAVPESQTGVAGAVSNGVARVAGLLAIAALPVLVQLPDNAATDPALFDPGFDRSMLAGATLFALGTLTAWCGLPGHRATTAGTEEQS